MTNNRKPQLSTAEKKAMFLATLPVMFWNISKVCDAVDISRAIYYVWLKEDPQFSADVALAIEERLDLIQEKSLHLVKELDGPQIRFELTHLGKARGYGKEGTDRPLTPGDSHQHVHFHLPPQPENLADWEKQTFEAREARKVLLKEDNSQVVIPQFEAAEKRMLVPLEDTPADVLRAKNVTPRNELTGELTGKLTRDTDTSEGNEEEKGG